MAQSLLASPLQTTVLFVDDDYHVRRHVTDWLRQRDCIVHVAQNCRTGLNEVLLRHPDVLLLDLGLPDGSGLELITALRDRGATLPIVILSGHDNPLEVFDASRLGAQDFIQKPALADQIAAVLHRVARSGGDCLQQVVRRLRAGLSAADHHLLRRWLILAAADDLVDLIGFRQICGALRLTRGDAYSIDYSSVQGELEAAQSLRDSLDAKMLNLLHAISRFQGELATRTALDHVEQSDCQRLRSLTGLSHHGWTRLDRLRRAIQRLITSDEHVRQIAIQLHFAHGGQLCRDVGELTGLSPSHLRAVAAGRLLS